MNSTLLPPLAPFSSLPTGIQAIMYACRHSPNTYSAVMSIEPSGTPGNPCHVALCYHWARDNKTFWIQDERVTEAGKQVTELLGKRLKVIDQFQGMNPCHSIIIIWEDGATPLPLPALHNDLVGIFAHIMKVANHPSVQYKHWTY